MGQGALLRGAPARGQKLRLMLCLDDLPVRMHLRQRLEHRVEQRARRFGVMTVPLKFGKQRRLPGNLYFSSGNMIIRYGKFCLLLLQA